MAYIKQTGIWSGYLTQDKELREKLESVTRQFFGNPMQIILTDIKCNPIEIMSGYEKDDNCIKKLCKNFDKNFKKINNILEQFLYNLDEVLKSNFDN